MERTNEELAMLIQSGQKEHVLRLWAQVVDFVRYMADRYLLDYPKRCQEFRDDLINESYFSLMKAVEGYDEEKGKFVNYFAFHLKTGFRKVLIGLTEKTRNDPMRDARSLDAPMGESDDLTLGELLVDAEGEEPYRDLENREFWRSVNRLIEAAIENLREEQREFFSVMFERGTKVSETMRIMGIDMAKKDRYRYLYDTGLAEIRKHIKVYLNRNKGRDIALEECVSYYTGVGAWKNHGFTSSVELAVMKRNDRRMTAQAMEGVFSLRP